MDRMKFKDLVDGEVSRGLSGKTTNEGKSVPFINIKDLDNGRVDTKNLEKKELPVVKNISRFMAHEGDVLFTVKGPSFKSALVDADSKGRVISSNIISFRVNEEILLPEIVVAYLNSPEGKLELDSIARGIATSSISINNFLELTIPVPSIETQVALKEYLNSVNRYLETLHQEEELVKKIKEYIISSLLGDIA